MKKLYTLLLIMSTLLFGQVAYGDIRAGVHYVELPFGSSVSKGNRVEVREFFWYGCPHCNTFEPHLNKWRKSAKHVDFVRSPAFLSLTEMDARNDRHKQQIRKFYLHARMYFALKKLGVLEKVHGKIFHAMHKQNKRLGSLSEITTYVASKGVNKSKFTVAMESDAIANAVHQSRRLELGYNIRSVPILVVDGRYMTSPGMAGGRAQAIAVLNHLVRLVRKEKTKGRR
jgi:thiol:disulfide interchange protein DsbA